MKYTFIIALLFLGSRALPQEKSEIINTRISLENKKMNMLWIDNIHGEIEVNGYDGSEIILEVKKDIKARNQEELDRLWEKISLKVENTGDTVEVFIGGTCAYECKDECECGRRRSHYCCCCNSKDDFEFNFDFSIKVPYSTNLILSTINKGNIVVNQVSGAHKINNVNGGIRMDGISGPAEVHTINGDVYVKYLKTPDSNSRYYTLNGNLNIYFPNNLSADMSFKSFNGEYFTDFTITESLKPTLVTREEKGASTIYKIDEKTAVRVGNGGVNLDFETFNGNIYIRKNSN
ncbi:MAG TPA: hypothetical protein VI583_04860 [Cyclobacteriaceae bacterium]|nr:hypothetical protein [Cyclobacteriaceae bacterium]